MAAPPLILGHRGDPRRKTENTLASFESALRSGADGVETDVRAAKDGLVLHHDEDLRIGRRRRPLADLTMEELPQAVPTVPDFVNWGRGRPALFDVEIKEPGTGPDIARACRPIQERCVFTSFHPDEIQSLRAADPRLRLGWITKAPADAVHTIVAELRPSLVVLAQRRCSSDLVKALADAGVDVWAWTVNDPRVAARLTALGIVGLITDEPARLVAWRDGAGRRRTDRRTGRQGS